MPETVISPDAHAVTRATALRAMQIAPVARPVAAVESLPANPTAAAPREGDARRMIVRPLKLADDAGAPEPDILAVPRALNAPGPLNSDFADSLPLARAVKAAVATAAPLPIARIVLTALKAPGPEMTPRPMA